MVLMLRPHIVCLVEVGKHTPGLAGYNIIQSEKKHCAVHIGEKQNEIIDDLEEVIRGKEAIRKMINMNRKKDIIIIWKIYSKLFVNKRTNTTIEEFLEKEIRDGNEFKSGQ